MHPVRKQRLTIVLFVVLGVALTTALATYALRQNINLYYTPTQIEQGEAPQGVEIKASGMVVAGSIKRDPGSLKVEFVVTDFEADTTIAYDGILPDLFREGQGAVARGRIVGPGRFEAVEILAKHDEEYMPPSVYEALKKSGNLDKIPASAKR